MWTYEKDRNKDGTGIIRCFKKPKKLLNKTAKQYRLRFCSKCGKTTNHDVKLKCMICQHQFVPMEIPFKLR